MSEPIINYDKISDTLYISFCPGEKATGIELNENMLLRINKKERRAIGLSIFNYLIIAQRTDAGLRSFPLTGLSEISQGLREEVLIILQSSPLKEILTVSTYTPSFSENIPITSLREETPLLTA